MDGYNIIALSDMLEDLEEDRVKSILSSFICPLNADVQDFLQHKAIEFDKQGIAPTHLVFASYKSEIVLAGYYTLTIKSFCVEKKALSNTQRKRISKFGIYEDSIPGYRISAPLIAQLGKNYNNGYDSLITGDELLKLACDTVKKVQRIAGGKIVYLECEDKERLTTFYTRNGFFNFGKRTLDRDEDFEGKYLIQMLRYIK